MSSFGNSNSQDVDLNITPIIDCFTVLITFLLASASFISIGFFEAYTPGKAADAAQAEPDTELVVKINSRNQAVFTFKGKRHSTQSFNLADEGSKKQLDVFVKSLSAPGLKLNQILVSADDSVNYLNLAKLMDSLNQSQIPLVVGEF